MANYPPVSAGQRITSTLLNLMVPDFTVKGTSESVTSSTTLQDDNDLQYTITQAGTYKFESMLFVGAGDSAADIKVAFAFPSGAISFWATGPHTAAITSGTSGDTEFFAINGAASGSGLFLNYGVSSGATIGIRITGVLVGTSTGSFKFQWAQNSSSATPTTLLAGSWMEIRRVA